MTALVPGDARPDLDAAQRRIVERPAASSFGVLGAPGSGKTTALVHRAAALATAVGVDGVLVLTPTRGAAKALRDTLALRVGMASGGSLARSLPSFAFQIVRAAAVHRGEAAPQLLTGGDEDRIIRDLLLGDAEDDAAGIRRWPAAVDHAVRERPGFRAEVRAFIAACTELGISPAMLRGVADAGGVEAWTAMASFIEEYRDVLDSMREPFRDAATLIAEAAALLDRAEGDEPWLVALRPLRAVLVDDAQELTHAGLALLAAVRRFGIGVVAAGDPDISAGSFRGASPEHFAALVSDLGDTVVLRSRFRGTPAQQRLLAAVTERIGASGAVAHRHRPDPEPVAANDASVCARIVDRPAAEYAVIARVLRERHVRDGVPWGRCAVIAHDSRQVLAIEAELGAREVPARVLGSGGPLREHPRVRDLAELVLVSVETRVWDPQSVQRILAAGGLDAIDLRRLRADVVRRRTAAAAAESSASVAAATAAAPAEGETPAQSLAAAFAEPDFLAGTATREGRTAARVHALASTIRAEHARGASAHELLWLAWEAVGSQDELALLARGAGPLAAHAGHELDAVVALMQAAKRFGERQPAAEALEFFRGVLDSDVAEDRLEAAADDGAVSVLTPAAAVGTSFDTVVIAGLQDGTWPNTRVRGGLLESWRLAELGLPEPATELDRRRGVLHDELRLFARAISRAERLLLLTAVSDDDRAPSPLFELVRPVVGIEQAQQPVPLSLRGLVAQHRRALVDSVDAASRAHAAAQLALLADAGVPGADPAQWYGLAQPTAVGGVRAGDEPVHVSPSRMHALEECELNWAIVELGGEGATRSAGLGTVLHAVLEHAESTAEDELWRAVEERWSQLEFETPWREEGERRTARSMVAALARYLRDFEQEGGRLLQAEGRFEVPIAAPGSPDSPGAVLVGAVDRVELRADGKVVIVDMKTGRSEPETDAKVVDHPQLAAYQFAHARGAIPASKGLPAGGARLLLLRASTKSSPYRTPHQAALDDAGIEAFAERVLRAADVARSSVLRARPDSHCESAYAFGYCRVHAIPAVSAP